MTFTEVGSKKVQHYAGIKLKERNKTKSWREGKSESEIVSLEKEMFVSRLLICKIWIVIAIVAIKTEIGFS